LWLNFNYINSPNDYFDVFYQGQNIGFFALSDLPVVIEHFEDNGEPVPVIGVCINDTPDCCAETEFEAPDCAPCNIWDLSVTTSDCEAGMFYVTLDFEYEHVGGDGFKVQGNGISYGVFDYGNLPLTLGPLVGDSTTHYEFAVKDVLHPDCHAAVELGLVDCDQSGDCGIFDAVADPLECHSDGTYDVAINFGVTFPGNNFFNVKYEDETIVHHAAIANLPYIIEHFEGGDNPHPVLLICINDMPDCCEEVQFDALDCPATDCHIHDVIAEAHDCDSNGQFLVDIAFEYQNTGSEGFTIVGNGNNYGTFDYGEPFYTIGPVAGNGTIYEFVVKDLELDDCHGFVSLGPVYCDTDCHIYDLVADLTDCDDDGQFYVTLNFEFENVGNDGFKVHGNGNVYGVFNYDELPVTIGPFTGNGDELEFVVSDFNHPDCHDYIEIEAPDCEGGGDCHIYDLTADVHPCLPNGTFFVSLDFAHDGTSGYFKVKGNGINYGVFSYDDLPVSIGPLVGNGGMPFEFLVQDIHFHDCAEDVYVGPVDCGPAGDCAVFNVVADPGACDDDGSYNLWVNFEFENASNNYFDFFHNGDLVDYFPLSSIPVVVPHIYENGDSIQTVTICINDNPGCCDSTTYATPDCNIGNLVWPGDANADNIVNNFDLLHLGAGYGEEGPPRVIQGMEWTGLEAEDWNQVFLSNLNYKHADCNGDGIINAGDMGAIFLNYGESHDSITPAPLIGGIETDPPIYVDLPEADVLLNGLPFTAPIILGTESRPVQNAYGIAFTLRFDPMVIDPASIEIQYDPSWLGVQSVNLLTFDQSQASDGIIEVALVRTDGNNVSGFGQVAGFIGIIDNIAGKELVTIEITDVKAISENEKLIPLYRQTEVVDLVTATNEQQQDVIRVYPNPAGQYVIISHPDDLPIESVQLKDMNGRTLKTEKLVNNQLDISALPAGVYTLHIKAGEAIFVNRIVKL
ncbi:MAG: T9SS type A sorting domain-containing protein, partial [Saprospiraceae bacterium]